MHFFTPTPVVLGFRIPINRFSRFSRPLPFLALIVLFGCAETKPPPGDVSQDNQVVPLFDAAMVIQDNWRQLPLRGKTDYRLTVGDDGVVIRATGMSSASGLIRRTNLDTAKCGTIEWRWRVDQIQTSADLHDKKREDVAASIFFLFGDPGFMSTPEPVPTLRYVWTNERHSEEDVIDNPYLPGVVRSIVIRTGESGRWFTESRNIRKDYEHAFGAAPTDWVQAIALFTDNEQTKEPTMAYYRWGRALCAAQAASKF